MAKTVTTNDAAPQRPIPEFRPYNLVKAGEAASILNVSTMTIRNYIKQGLLHAKRTPGGQYLLDRTEVTEFLESLVVEGSDGK